MPNLLALLQVPLVLAALNADWPPPVVSSTDTWVLCNTPAQAHRYAELFDSGLGLVKTFDRLRHEFKGSACTYRKAVTERGRIVERFKVGHEDIVVVEVMVIAEWVPKQKQWYSVLGQNVRYTALTAPKVLDGMPAI